MLDKLLVKDLMTKDVLTVDKEVETVFAFEGPMKNKINAMHWLEGEKMVGIVPATDWGHNWI